MSLLLLVVFADGANAITTHPKTFTQTGNRRQLFDLSRTSRDWGMCYNAAGNICRTHKYTIDIRV